MGWVMEQHSEQVKEVTKNSIFIKVLPWVAGVGVATTQALSSSHCSALEHGQCSKCGSCVLALGGLVIWAVSKNKDRDDFFIEK